MNFCSHCGANTLHWRVPEGDNRPRYVCAECATVHYQNPKIVAGCILEWQGRVLLCRRGIQPRHGFWTLPAGFMENGEGAVAAASREALEEANAVGDDLHLYGIYSLPHISQVYLLYRGILRDGQASAGEETLEVALFDEASIPWDELAFTIVHDALAHYFPERRQGAFQLHSADIHREADGGVRIQRFQPLGLGADFSAL